MLESIVMLYDRTQDEKYLDFAEHIVAMSENNPKLRLMGAMLDRESVVYSGDGKAYQLMANLLGYLGLYRNTGDERYLKTVQNAWHDIKTRHVDVTGGPWGRHMTYNGNRECFALLSDYDPAAVDVETCSTTTWVQLNLHLLEVTGQAKYAVEAERALFNAIMAAQNQEALDWCYYRMVRTWKTGDEIALEFEYLLKTHIVTPKDDPVWVAFTYGPWALAQTTSDGVAVAEPFIGEEVRSTSVSQWIEPQSPDHDAVPKFRIRNTEIQLGPFYSAGSRETGPRTYFRLVETNSP